MYNQNHLHTEQSLMMMNNNPMLMGMGMGMGGMGGTGMGNNGAFFYRGNVIGLESRLDELMNAGTPVTEATISVTGNQIKQYNICCQMTTIIAGSFCIFPLCFMCCNWWKKMVNPAYEVPIKTYQKLAAVLLNPNIKSVTLYVTDSTFGIQKSQILYGMLTKSSAKGFTFTNVASPVDYNEYQFSNFRQYMKQIKTLPIMTDLKWWDKIVL